MTDLDPVTYTLENGVAIITTNAPPVNALGARVRARLVETVTRATADKAASAIVLLCEGRTFFAGADISEFGKPPVEPSLRDLLKILEASDKPTVSAIHGAALGGGLELALVTHFRIAEASAKFGLPEVNIGILPGAGGTQRLPRLIGAEKALDMITSGSPVSARTALEIGLIDATAAQGQLREAATAFARQVVVEQRPLVRIANRPNHLEEGTPELFERWRSHVASRYRGLIAPLACIDAIEAAFNLPIKDGLIRERALFDRLVAGPQAKALRHLFFAERQAKKPDAKAAASIPRPVRRVGIVGAGTMGTAIATNLANGGLETIIVETSQAGLDRGLATIRRHYERSIANGQLDAAAVEPRMRCIRGSTTLADLADADLVIECAFETMPVKKDIFRNLDAIVREGAVLATTTSFLDIDEIAGTTSRPRDVVGMHFFSPANQMALVEIVRGKETASDVLATASDIARRIDKTGVTVGNSFGFVGNRILAARERQANLLILEGASPADVDRVLRDFGFPMGHFEMYDLVRLDPGWNREDCSSPGIRDILNEMGRPGQKAGKGYYDYGDDRRPEPSPVVEEAITRFAADKGIVRRDVTDAEIRDRLLFPMVNEGARLLEEKIAARASDIDVIAVLGLGWPRYRGGPMFWADGIGIGHVEAALSRLAHEHGAAFTPAPLLTELAKSGRGFLD